MFPVECQQGRGGVGGGEVAAAVGQGVMEDGRLMPGAVQEPQAVGEQAQPFGTGGKGAYGGQERVGHRFH